MPTVNYDASILTKRRRNYALFTFNRLNNAAVNAGTSVRREQPDTQLQEVLAQRSEVSANTNPTSQCPCTTPTLSNTGGNNSNNIG
jgi:hypothetical protein